VGNPQCAELFWPDLYRIPRHFRPGRTARRDGQIPALAGCRAVAAGERSAVSVALRSDDIDATHDQLRRKGLAVSPIVDGQRNDPQGNIIRWRIFTIDGDTDGLVYPFVLQWGEDETRLARLRAQGLDVPHPLGDIVLEQAVFEVVNPQAVRDRWQALLGFPSQGEQGLDVGGQWFIFREGPANQLTELVFRVANPALKGQRFRVGNGVYRFI
jgi:hypothetical protein